MDLPFHICLMQAVCLWVREGFDLSRSSLVQGLVLLAAFRISVFELLHRNVSVTEVEVTLEIRS